MTATPTLADLQSEANWLEWRSRIEQLPVLRRTEMVTTDQSRAEFIEGARLLRLDHMVRAGDGGTGPTPIQLAVADIINAGTFLNGIMEPRRTTKTTSVGCVLVGRCMVRSDYNAAFTMLTTGAKAGEWFRKNIVSTLRRVYPDEKHAPFKINVGKGTEHIAFTNGSWFNVYSPNGEGFRSGGFDIVLADEGGEATPELSEDITLAVLPTMDTKPGAQFVVGGTGARYRTGNILWEILADPTAAGLWHGIPETTDPAELETWEPTEENPQGRMRELIQLSHPGVGYTTPIEAVERNYNKFPREKFLMEYGGMFGLEGVTDTVIPPAWWERGALDAEFPPPPARFSAFLKVHHNGTSAALAVAWEIEEPRDLVTDALELDGVVDERPKRRAIGVWHHQKGTDRMDREVLLRARRHNIPIVYDDHGHTAVVAKKIQAAAPRTKLVGTKPRDIPLAAVTLMQGLEDGTVVHYRQATLDAAVGIAVKQSFGQYGSWRFGAPKSDPDADTVCLEAAAGALLFLADAPVSVKPADVFQF